MEVTAKAEVSWETPTSTESLEKRTTDDKKRSSVPQCLTAIEQRRQVRHAWQDMGVRLAAKLLHPGSSREDAYHASQAGVAAGLKVERRVANRHDLRHAAYARRFHGVKDHVRRRPAQHHIVTADRCHKVLLPSQTVEDGGCGLAVK